ncbi:MAG: hypothetical protein FWD68_16005 [Alphaproteobacteria bacterium]|nr:hypothetical protein [Alphaproteobacteria bacterium]
MASDAFAISPISARAVAPDEIDYDAIRDAFMETARGRWFLDEYARRNRNADTSMVLDAVTRIETTLARQRAQILDSRREDPVVRPLVDRLDELFTTIHRAVAEAQTSATSACDELALAAQLEPVRRASCIIREISWSWREIGADARICDLIDAELSAIDTACSQILTDTAQNRVKAAFTNLRQQIPSGASDGALHPRPRAIPPRGISPVYPVVPATTPHELRQDSIPEADPADQAARADAEDDAVLELVAAAMLDPADEGAGDEPGEAGPGAAVAVTETPEVASPPDLAAQPARVITRDPGAGRRLRKFRAMVGDPMEPIRRMSQAEKIAFFS